MASMQHSAEDSPTRRVLLVDDDEDFAASLSDLLKLRGYEIALAANGAQALKALGEFDPTVAMIDIRLGVSSGVEFLSQILAHRPELICVMMTAHADIETAIAAMRQGAYDYYEKSSGAGGLYAMLERSFEKHRLTSERKRVERELARTQTFLHTIVENMPAIVTVKDAVEQRYVLANRGAERVFGIPRSEIVGKRIHDLVHEDAADFLFEQDRRAIQSRGLVIIDEHVVDTPRNGARILATKKLPILGDDREPQYLLSLSEDITERKQAEARIAHMAQHDPLTDLPNRAAFSERLAFTLARAAATGDTFALLCLDLDRFKEINDVFGHSIGDELLREVSRRLEAATEGAFLARLGGDEFTLIATDGGQPSSAETLAARLLAVLADDLEIDGQRLRIGMSIGVAIFPTDGTDATTLLNNADAALYRAKAEGRATIRFFQVEMDKQLRERRAIQHELRSAIAHGELALDYQPQALIDGEIIGFEALLRWHNPSRGLISPGTFIPLAEESGLIISIGEWVLREACREAASWPRPLQIAINLSPIQFRHGDLPELVHSILLESGLPASRLELEITEGVLVEDFSRALSILRRLKSLGVRVAMDDFGTGYSSLSYLQSFPFDKIKIDKAFISNVERNPQSAAIVRAVIGLARGLDVPVLAEGVETKDQLAFLSGEACDEIQGYLLGPPGPMDGYAELVGRPASRQKSVLVG